MKTQVQTWIDFALQQIAAESYLDGFNQLSEEDVETRLTDGANNHKQRRIHFILS